jgi:hypothetical protein
MVFLDLILRADSGWGLGFVYNIALVALKVALFFLLLPFILYIKTSFPIETTIKNASKGGKAD